MDEPLMFLIKLAWSLKYRLPCLIAISFFLLDIRMQLEIQVHMRRIEIDPQHLPLRGGAYADDTELNDADSDDSWFTVDEDEE
ncbi:hypothetical protein FQR65_LT01731 [Abscondita terminalis]|nr:hypothetical protein FQR65_LT01731 [Abscondita terminalis]